MTPMTDVDEIMNYTRRVKTVHGSGKNPEVQHYRSASTGEMPDFIMREIESMNVTTKMEATQGTQLFEKTPKPDLMFE